MEKEYAKKPEQADRDFGTQETTRVESAPPPPFNPTAGPLDPNLGKASRQGIDEPNDGRMAEPIPAPKPKTDENKPKAAFSERDMILGGLVTAGAGEATATQDDRSSKVRGVAASEKLARTDLARVKGYIGSFLTVGAETGLPPALLAAIASRESRCGNTLDGAGTGDSGNGYGIMQVDRRYHDIADDEGPGGIAHVRQAANILLSMLSKVKKRFPQWTPAQQLRGAVAAYNFGDSNVQSWEGLDRGTSHDDYSADTWARARYYASLKAFNGTADLPATELPQPGEKADASTTGKTRTEVPAGRLIAEAVGTGGANHADDVSAVLGRMAALGVITEAETKDRSEEAVEGYVIRYQGMTVADPDGRIDPGGRTEANLIKGVLEKREVTRKPQREAGKGGKGQNPLEKDKPQASGTDGQLAVMDAAYRRLLADTPATPEGAQSILSRGDTFAANAFADLCRTGRWDMLHSLYSELWAFDRDWMAREIAAKLTEAEVAALPQEVRKKLWKAMDAGWTGSDEYALMEKLQPDELLRTEDKMTNSKDKGVGNSTRCIIDSGNWRTQHPNPNPENQIWKDSEAGWEACKYVAEKMVYRHLYKDLPDDFKRTNVINAPAGKYDYIVGATGTHEFLPLLRENKSGVRKIVPGQHMVSVFEEADSAEVAIEYLTSYITQGIPVVVGVDHTFNRSLKKEDGKTSSQNTFGYNEGTTDHFVTIVGHGVDEKGRRYFRFFDPGTQSKDDATAEKNKLIEIAPYQFVGKQPWKNKNENAAKRYTLTFVVLFAKDIKSYQEYVDENEETFKKLQSDFQKGEGDFSYRR